MLKIAYTCNDKMFDCLFLSILSIVRRCKQPIHFFILTGDFIEHNPNFTKVTVEHSAKLKELIAKYNHNNIVEIVDCREVYEKHLKDNPNVKNRCSIYTLLRLLLSKFNFFTDEILYLDTDTMICGDIAEVFKQDLKDNEFLVSHNSPYIKWYQNKRYFNGGVILFNTYLVKKNKTLDKSIKLVTSKKLLNPDQVALYKSATKYDFFDNEYRFNRQTTKIRDGDVIIHFCKKWERPLHGNIKQNEIKKVHKYYRIHKFDEDYKIFNKIQEEIRNSLRNEFFIYVNNLRKTYGALKAVNNISFKVKKGSLFAFLGINGAGKSTTINIISSTLKKDSGEIKVGGFDLDKENAQIKKLIGIVFQNSVLDNLLTVKENLTTRAKFYKMNENEIKKNLDRVIKMLDLDPILNQPVGKLSGGQKRRVDIARALIHEPKLLILDEPTTGLDPKTRLDVWKLVDDIRQRTGMTVFLTTHYLEEADKATYVVIMNKGQIITEGTPNELKNKFSTDTLIAYRNKSKSFENKIKKYKFRYDEDSDSYQISIKDGDMAKEILNKYSEDITDFEIRKGNMDDVFLNVTGIK